MHVTLTDPKLQATSSFDCDGCGHHASFHTMENPGEQEIVRRWQATAEAEAQAQALLQSAAPARKRARNAIEAAPSEHARLVVGLSNRAGESSAQDAAPDSASTKPPRGTRNPRGRRGNGRQRGGGGQTAEESREIIELADSETES